MNFIKNHIILRSIIAMLGIMIITDAIGITNIYDTVIKSFSYSESKSWIKNNVNSKEYGSKLYLKIFENLNGQKNIGIFTQSDECSKYSLIPINVPSMYINNQKVQMFGQCVAKGIRMDFPKTNAGRKYVVNEFKTKNEVIYKQDGISITFSAKGFTNNYYSFESQSDGL